MTDLFLLGAIEAGRCEFPPVQDEAMEKEFQDQMSARRRKTIYNSKTNQESQIWVEGKNDHARDLYNMQFFGATVEGLIPDPASERLSDREKNGLQDGGN